MPIVTALCGQLVLIVDTATSQGLPVPEFWAVPISTLGAFLVQTCHFLFFFSEMIYFLFNTQPVEVVIIHSFEEILASHVGEACPLPIA